jgi:transcriptional antiterminator RfaH
MPLRKQTFRRSGRWDTSLRPLFPGYLFIKVPDDRRQWRSINATYGVSRLVALEAGHPTPVDPDIVTALQARVGEHGELQPTAELEVGDHVRVLSGPLANKLAEIEVISEQNRIYVLLELMGHYTKAVLAAANVERV